MTDEHTPNAPKESADSQDTSSVAVTIRRFESSDTEAVIDLHERALRDAGTDPADVPGTDDLSEIEQTYLDTGGEFLVLERDDAIIAMGGLTVSNDEAELFRMRVDPSLQRQGYGSMLLDALEETARNRGVDRLLAETAARQTAATQFYPAHGYHEIGRDQYDEYELITFEKEL